ncbi:concanavalin A-like lectin/glucanase [Piromyces finnis]|uniref:endo-1,4-beta-xylanase n=1 Tax=Piromyces finnis TaxID=1754191 RepID=A0A1Y1UY08_9FUNG|nr:concanavalin A-like lectin/glucanase [Piromyces finnis]|eukprot:ORX42606.1 concanavalin A-like lectin/glucanase [Piromyces finnis]
MKKYSLIKSLLSIIVSTNITNAYQFCNKIEHTGESVVEMTYNAGKIGGIDYDLWFKEGINSATFYSDGSMTCSFQDTMNYMCRTGIKFDSTKTFNQIGHLYADFKYIENNNSNVDYSYIGVYGLTKHPQIEFYIVENWIGDNHPENDTFGKNYGDFIINGEEYTIYESEPVGKSINGETPYKKFYSFRKTPSSCGSIDITAHFEQWDNIGLTLGYLYEAKVFAQVGSYNLGTSGSIDFPYALVYVKDGIENKKVLTFNAIPTTSIESNTINEIIPTVSTEYNYNENSNANSYDLYNNGEITVTKVISSITESIIETEAPYDISKENDINFILAAETVEPEETYIIPDYIPPSSTIIRKETYLPPIINEEYVDNTILQDGNNEESKKVENDNCVPLYGQCGGKDYNGSTCCKEGKCAYLNEWYYQCIL